MCLHSLHKEISNFLTPQIIAALHINRGTFDYSDIPQNLNLAKIVTCLHVSYSAHTQGGSWDFSGNLGASSQNNFEGEPPLLEELGIDMKKIVERTLSVVNPLKKVTNEMMTSRSPDGQVIIFQE